MFKKRSRLKENADAKYIIVSAYEEFLRRTPSEKEASYWLEQIINSKITFKDFFRAIANSDEIKNSGQDLYFDGMLGKLYKLLTGNPLDSGQADEIQKIKSCESLVSGHNTAALRYVLFNGISVKNLQDGAQKIIYLHIPKCAGNSVIKYFEYALGGNNLLKFNFNGFLFDNEKWLDDCKSLFSYVKFITAAHCDFNACEKIPGNKRIIAFFREPKSRLLSAYYYFKSYKLSFISSLPKERQDYIVLNIAKTHDLLSFLKSRNSYVLNTIDNTMTRCLTGFFVKNNCNIDYNGNNDKLYENPEKTLEIALKNLDKIELAGILEKFDLSLNLFSKVLKIKGPQINNYKENITESNFAASSTFEKIKEEPLTEELEKELERLTGLDKIIYGYALEKFNNQVRQFTDCL